MREFLRTWGSATIKAANIRHKWSFLLSSTTSPYSLELMGSNHWKCKAFLCYGFIMMGPGRFNVAAQVIPGCVALALIFDMPQKQHEKVTDVVIPIQSSWFQRGSLWLKGPPQLCSKKLTWRPFLNFHMSSSLLATSSCSSRDSAHLGPRVHFSHQP